MSDQQAQRDRYAVTLMCAVFLLEKHEGGDLHVGSKTIRRRITKIAKAKMLTDTAQVFDAVSRVVQLAEELSLKEAALQFKRDVPLTDIRALKQSVSGSLARDHAPINTEFAIELMLEYDQDNFAIKHGEIVALNQRIVERTGVPEGRVREIVSDMRHEALKRYEAREERGPTDDRLIPRLELVQTGEPAGSDASDETASPPQAQRAV